jgi:hypothetical protein
MAAPSFRDILNQFLDEKSGKTASSPSEKAEFAPPKTDFTWQAPEFQGKRRHLYPPPSTRTAPPVSEVKPAPVQAPLKGKPLEPEWSLSKFSEIERACVTKLIEMGGYELKGKDLLTRSLLKSVHRRLVKLHHPDVLIKVVNEKERARRQEIFLGMQQAYETVNSKLIALSASAGGNGSASASESRHQDAA